MWADSRVPKRLAVGEAQVAVVCPSVRGERCAAWVSRRARTSGFVAGGGARPGRGEHQGGFLRGDPEVLHLSYQRALALFRVLSTGVVVRVEIPERHGGQPRP